MSHTIDQYHCCLQLFRKLLPILLIGIPEFHFGFINKHSIIDLHRVTLVIEMDFDEKKYYPVVFLNVPLAFDTVCE